MIYEIELVILISLQLSIFFLSLPIRLYGT